MRTHVSVLCILALLATAGLAGLIAGCSGAELQNFVVALERGNAKGKGKIRSGGKFVVGTCTEFYAGFDDSYGDFEGELDYGAEGNDPDFVPTGDPGVQP